MKRMFPMAIAALLPAVAQAQHGPGTWQFEAMPYLWAAGMEGDAGVGRLLAGGVEVGFDDIRDNLRTGFMGSFEGRRGNFGFYGDAIYMKLHQSHPASRPLFGDVDAKVTQQAYALAGTWRACAEVDLFAGARTNYIKLDFDLSSSALAPQGRSAVRNRDWVDGYIGVRVRHALGERWALTAYADIGKGGSDLTWQVMAGADYAITKDLAAKLGYRYFKVEYDKGDFLYDMASAGAYLGLALRF